MRFTCALYVVKDVNKSRAFYERLLDQRVIHNFGENVVFEGDFSIHKASHFVNMVSIESDSVISKSNSGELYFETEDLTSFIEKLERSEYEIEYLHKLKEHPWGQRVIRFYDLDKHIIEVGEAMDSVIKRFLEAGKSIEDVSERTQYPVSYIEQIFKA